MSDSARVSFRVFIGIEIGCFLLLGFGVVMLFSPLWTPGGLLAWWDGYRREEDVLGIVWLGSSILSVFVGILLAVAAAVVAVWTGIAAGIVGLAKHRAGHGQEAVAGLPQEHEQKLPAEPEIRHVEAKPNEV